jgi:hypothetical protein
MVQTIIKRLKRWSGKLGDARREMASLSEEPWPSSAAGYQLGPKIGEVRPRERVGAVL